MIHYTMLTNTWLIPFIISTAIWSPCIFNRWALVSNYEDLSYSSYSSSYSLSDASSDLSSNSSPSSSLMSYPRIKFSYLCRTMVRWYYRFRAVFQPPDSIMPKWLREDSSPASPLSSVSFVVGTSIGNTSPPAPTTPINAHPSKFSDMATAVAAIINASPAGSSSLQGSGKVNADVIIYSSIRTMLFRRAP